MVGGVGVGGLGRRETAQAAESWHERVLGGAARELTGFPKHRARSPSRLVAALETASPLFGSFVIIWMNWMIGST